MCRPWLERRFSLIFSLQREELQNKYWNVDLKKRDVGEDKLAKIVCRK